MASALFPSPEKDTLQRRLVAFFARYLSIAPGLSARCAPFFHTSDGLVVNSAESPAARRA